MEVSQRNIRLMHYIGEFLDLDFASFNSVAEFIALIQAMREGLTHIDEYFTLPDFELNILFLSKLESHPDWKDWATAMMRNKRMNRTDPAQRMTFSELASLAIEYEKSMRQKAKKDGEARSSPDWTRPRALTQEEINAFVMQQMGKGNKQHQQPHRGHNKRPSQEEINEFVVQQMRKEQERKTRARSHSQPELRKTVQQQKSTAMHCTFCGDRDHRAEKCWRRLRVVAEMPRANFTPKRVEFKTEIPGQPSIYHGGFTVI